jgi:hypothetical protein
VTIKRILIGVAIGFVAVLLALEAVWLMVSDTVLLAFVDEHLESSLAASISFQQPAKITRTLSPVLSVTSLVVVDNDERYRFRTDSLQVQISLPKLLLGKLDIARLWLGDTHVEFTHRDTSVGGGRVTVNSFQPFLSELHDVRISHLSIGSGGGETRLPRLGISELTIKHDADSDSLLVSSRVDAGKYPLDFHVTLAGISKTATTHRLPVAISLQGASMNLSANGHVEFSQALPRVEADVQGRVSDLKRFITGIDGLDVPGELTARARLTGPYNRIALETLSAKWQGPGRSMGELSGRIANINELAGFDLALHGRLGKADWLTPALPQSMGPLETAEFSAQLSGDYGQLALRAIRLEADDAHQLNINLAGQLDVTQGSGGPALENMDLALTFSAPTTRAARALLFENVPELGAVTGSALVRSQKGDPAFENVVVRTRDGKGIAVDLKGRIADFPLSAARPNQGYKLEVTMKATSISLMGERMGWQLPLSGPLDLKFRIEGDTRALQLNRIVLSGGSSNALKLGATGNLSFGEWDRADPLRSIDLNWRADFADTKSLGAVLGRELPELGAFSAQGRLHTVAGSHRLDDLRLRMAEAAPLKVSLDGSARQVVFWPKPAIDGIRFTLFATSSDVARLNALFGWKKRIPAVGPVEARATISGNDRNLAVSDVTVTAGQADILLAEATGRLGSFGAASNWKLQDTDISVQLASTDSSALARTLGYRLPELGPLSGKARLHDIDNTLAMDAVELTIGNGTAPMVRLNGAIGDIVAARGVRAEVMLDIDSHHLAEFSGYPGLRDLNPLQGRMLISDSDGTLGIDSLHIETSQAPSSKLRLDGQFSDFRHLDTLLLNSRLTADDLQSIGKLFDRQWDPVGPVQVDIVVSKVANGIELKGSLTAGKLAGDADLIVDLTASPPHVSGTISAQQFFLPDLFPKTTGKRKHKAKTGPVFASTPIDFSYLKKADLDLAVDVSSADAARSEIESAKFKITLKSGDLTVNPAELLFPRGKLDFNLELLTRGKPRIHFKAYGENINPRQTLDMQAINGKTGFDANLDVDLQLTATGVSQHELVSSLDGDIYLTVMNGRMRRSLMDMLFVDLAGWTTSQLTTEKYIPLTCGVADYSIRDGLVSTNAFFLDSRNITISGDGSVDLVNERIDYVFLPHKKSRMILKADPVKVKGPLNNPSVEAIPWKSAATTYGTLFFAPYIFVGLTVSDFLYGEVSNDTTESPCLKYEKMHRQRETKPRP